VVTAKTAWEVLALVDLAEVGDVEVPGREVVKAVVVAGVVDELLRTGAPSPRIAPRLASSSLSRPP